MHAKKSYRKNQDARRAHAREYQRRKRAAAKTSPRVYFIFDGEFIKIGYSAQLQHRLQSASRWNPRELRVLAQLDGDHMTEATLHAQFAHLRVRGEWFRAGEDLMQYIREIP